MATRPEAERARLVSYCDHCGNQSYKELVAEETVTVDRQSVTHRLYRCEICQNVILIRTISRVNVVPTYVKGRVVTPLAEPITSTEEMAPEQLWPPPLTLPMEVPTRVRELYEEARSVRQRSPNSFAVQIRRALEAVATDRGAQGRNLNSRLNWLVQSESLPEVLGRMGHINKMLGNIGAHDAETDVGPEDVEIIDEFFRAIVEYLYVAPARVAKVQALLEARRGN